MGVETTGWLQRGQDNTCRTMSVSGRKDPLGVGVPRYCKLPGFTPVPDVGFHGS